MAVSVLCLFLTMPWVGLQSVIVAFPGQSYSLFCIIIFYHLFFVIVRASPVLLEMIKKDPLGGISFLETWGCVGVFQ